MRPDLRRLALFLGIAALLFGTLLSIVSLWLAGQPLTVPGIVREAIAWVTIATSLPVVLAFGERRARARTSRFRTVLSHLGAFVLLVLFHVTAYNGIVALLYGTENIKWALQAFNFARYDALLYPLMIAAVLTTRQRRLTRRSELAAVRLQRMVAEAQLQHVRLRLDPEEIIAELAAIESILTSDPGRAEQRLHGISRSLRLKLHRIATGLPGAGTRRRARTAGVPRDVRTSVLLMSTAFGIYLAVTMMVWRLARGAHTWVDLLGTLAAFFTAGLFTAAVIPFFRRALAWRVRSSVGRVVAIVGMVVVCAAEATLIELLMAGMRRFGLGRAFAGTFDFVIILTIVSLYLVAFDDLKALQRQSRFTAEQLAAALAEARLRSLRTQLEPHFLFNTLNSILALVRHDPAGARQMLVRLRSLLRVATDHRERQEVTLREDLEMTRSYLDIEKVRFRDAIDVSADVDEALLDACVPSFLLQPLVENAIRHGALASLGHGQVHVIVEGDHGALAITVRNDGQLLDPSGWREGIGLSNIRARLAQMYGSDHELSISVNEESGVSVRLRLPLRIAA